LLYTEKRNITDERAALSQALTELEQNGLGDNKIFVSGTDEPNLGDVNLFGTLRAIEGLPAHQQAVEERGGPIPEWYERMTEKVDFK
jgi:hypothetical protein